MTQATAAANRAASPASIRSDEEQCVVFVHRCDPTESQAAIDRTLTRMAADKRQGDVMTVLKEFRDNPRG